VRHVTRLRALTAAGASLIIVGGGVAAASFASASVQPARVSVTGTHPAWATAKALVNSTVTGSVTANVYLAPQAGLAAYAQAVSTPGSAAYGHYLTAAAALAKYGPTAAEASQVETWAKGAGLTVGTVTSGAGAYVQVTGSAAAIASAFSVKFGNYRDGKATYRAPETAATIPGLLSGDVLTVSGLDSATHQMKPDTLKPGAVQPTDVLPPAPQNYFVAPHCSTYYGQKITSGEYGTVAGTSTKIPTVNGKAQPWTDCGYTPQQIRSAYNVNKSGETGKGVTVAVVDAYASPTMLSDANSYAAWALQHGGSKTLDKPFRAGQYKQVLLGGTNGWQQTTACGANGWYGEESLDVESVHGMAPDANVTYVGAVSCDDADLGNALAYIVNHHAADIVTDSWGEPADTSTLTPVYDAIFQFGAIEGIGFFFSSGDSGYEDPNYQDNTDMVQVDYPTSSPWVTSVGGTSLAIGSKNNYEFETGWGTILDPLAVSSTGVSSWTFTPTDTSSEVLNGLWDGSGGGGVSYQYQQPWYQKAVVPKSLATTEVVSSPVDFNGSLFGYNESTTTVKNPMRVIPDVSALADPSTGPAVGETLLGTDGKTYAFYVSRIGGTSVASPIFAGIEADAEQAARHPIGFANPAIYWLDSHSKTAFNDVTDHPGGAQFYEVRSNYTDPGTKALPLNTFLRLLGTNGIDATLQIPASSTVTIPLTVQSALKATKGYDDETGVGSPNSYIDAFKFGL
jgi:subtilase family serine protease